MAQPNSITITFLAKVSFASLNGADKDVDNINPIRQDYAGQRAATSLT